MSKPKWRFKIKPDGKVEVEGFDFDGNACVSDIIYKLIHENALVEKEERHTNFGEERPVENVYYVGR